MKNVYKKLLTLIMGLCLQQLAIAQCATITPNGSATNMFTVIRNGNNPVAVNKSMNMVVFVHRNNVANFGGSSGELRYDISTTAGSTWTVDQGILNPINSNYARYPNLAIYNPSLNTVPTNAYVSYLAPTITSMTSVWNGIVSGVRQLNGTGTTEAYNQNGIGTNQIPHSLVNGAPGVFWAVDPIVPSGTTGYYIYKGVWNGTLMDVVWNINYTVTPAFNLSLSSFPFVGDYNIAFDPTGTIGYFSFLGHVSPGPSDYAYYPVLYKTVNGGNTWTGPIQVDLGKLSCIGTNVVSSHVPSANVEHDLVVDVNGNPHIITTLGSATNYGFNYSAWHHMFDITLRNGLWAAYDLGNVNGAPFTFGISPDFATQWQAPQAARTADGTKVFFTWTDNGSYSLGTGNSLPNLFGKALDVISYNWTPTKDFTSCNPATTGRILFPHLAPEVLEPIANNFKLAPIYGEPTSPNNLIVPADFKFLDNIAFTTSEFTLATPNATVTIPLGPNLTYCPGSTVNVNVSGAGQVLWSNGSTVIPFPLNTGTVNTYSVIAQVGCLIGTGSISVTNLTLNAGAVTPSICPGNLATFTVNGSALSYTWLPPGTGGTITTVSPGSGSVTLMAFGSGNCVLSNTVSVALLPVPTISITGNNTICAGAILTQIASGASSYLWSGGITGSTYTASPLSNTVISVLGTGANSCTNTATVNLYVNPTPTVGLSAGQSSLCNGQTTTLFATGATSYSWNGLAGSASKTIAPTSNTGYTVTGANTFSCADSKTIEITVFTLPSLTVTQNRAGVCKGEKVTLTASGGNTYTWVTQGIVNASISITPAAAQTYTYQVLLIDANACSAAGSYSLVVSACTGISGAGTLSDQLLIYPNPNVGHFTISSAAEVTLKMTNALGQEINSYHLHAANSYKINVEGLATGMYFIESTHAAERVVKKIIVSQH